MKKLLTSILVVLSLWSAPVAVFAQSTVVQGGTGLNAVSSGYLLFGSTTLRLATSTNLFFDFTNNIFRTKNASTTALSAFSAAFGGTATSTFNTAGVLTLITPLAVTSGGTGATSLNNLITLATHTIGNFIATLTSSGSITVANSGSEDAAVTVDLNMANANSWTALQSFSAASTTMFSCLGNCAFGATATSSFNSAGVLTLITPLAVTSGGTGATSLNNLITLGTHTTGNYLATLTSSGSITVANSGSETAAVTADLNMGNANIWTALQTFNNASTTNLSVLTKASFGSTATSSFDSAGVLTLITPLAVTSGGTGATSLNNLITLGTHTSGAYVASVADSLASLTITGTAAESSANDLTINLAHRNDWTAHQTFASLNATIASTTNATSTNQSITGNLSFGGVVASTWAAFCTTITGGSDLCDGTDATGGGSGSVSTSTNEVANQVAVFTSNSATPATIGGDTDFIFSGNLLQITQASSSMMSVYGPAYFGATATSSFSSAGVLTLITPLAVTSGGTGATSLNDLITLATHTAGNYLATLTSSGSITVGNSGTENAAATVDLNMANANIWTALQTFGNASTTNLSVLTKASFGSTATSSFNSAGVLTLITPLAVTSGGTGATSLNDLITLGTMTTGNYLATLADSGGGTLTIANSGSETAAVTAGINLANANSWTGKQTFSLASTTMFSCLTNCAFGSTATSSFNSAGVLTLITPLAVTSGGTGATSLNDIITLGTHTSGAYVQSVADSLSSLTITGTAAESSANDITVNLAHRNDWSVHQTFSSLFATIASTTNATSTNQSITGNLTFNGVTASTWAAFCSTITGGSGLCDGTDATGAASSGNVATSTNEVANQVAVFTSNSATPATIGGDTDFTFSGDKLTITNASSTNLSVLTKASFGSTATSSFDSAGVLTLITPLAVTSGGIGTNTLTNLITLATHTVGNYLATLTSSGSITVGNSGTENAAATVDLNMANANVWTALQTFGNASTTNLSVLTKASFGSTATSSFDNAGVLTLITPLAVTSGGTGATSLNNLITLGTHTSGAYVASVADSLSSLTITGTAAESSANDLTINLAHRNDWTAHQTFASLNATIASTTDATSTNQSITGNLSFNGVVASTWAAFCTTITGGSGLCDGTDADTGGSGSSKWATTTAATDAIRTAFPSARVVMGTSTATSLTTLTVSATSTDTTKLLSFLNDTSAEVGSLTDEGLLTLGDSTAAGDATAQFGPDSFAWAVGFDDTDDSFAISSSTVLGTNNALTIQKSGLAATFGGSLTVSGTNFIFGGDTFDELVGAGLSLAAGDLTVNDVTAAMLVSGDFGEFSCNGTTCTLDAESQSIEELSDVGAMTEAYGDQLTWNGTGWTNFATSSLDLFVTGLGSSDFGDWTCNGTTCTVDADAIALATDTTGNYVATLSSSGSVTFANSGSENAAMTGDLNMANANTWTALQTFANASTTGYHSFGTASSTNWTGGGLTDCDAESQTVSYDATTQKFGCLADAGAGAVDGTGFAGGWAYFTDVDSLSASSSPTVQWITATSSAASSTLPWVENARLHVTSWIQIGTEVISNFTNSVVAAVAAASSMVLTGAWDFGGATSIEIVNNTDPTVNAAGEVAINTTAASSSLRFFDGTAERSLNSIYTKSTGPVASSTLVYMGSFGAAGTTTLRYMKALHPFTVVSAYCETDTGTAFMNVNDGTNNSTTVPCSTAGTLTTLSSNNTFTMNESFRVSFGTSASAPNTITASFNIQDTAD